MRLLIATDAWRPQVNGVVRTLERVGEELTAVGVEVTEVVESAAPPRLVYDPASPAADEQGYVAMPNVNVVEEMVNMISASRAYQNNAEVMSTARTLMQRTLQIGQGQ